MSNTRLPNSIFFILVALGAVQLFYYSPRLPRMVGSHFGTRGVANDWQPKTLFFCIELGIIVLAIVVSFGIPRIIEVLPVSLINLPRKEFWLSPDRRAETLLYLRVWNAWFGCALLAFLLFVMELVFRANLHNPPQLSNAAFIPALGAFAVFDTILIVRLVLHFSKAQKH
jgi:hypothetical protein